MQVFPHIIHANTAVCMKVYNNEPLRWHHNHTMQTNVNVFIPTSQKIISASQRKKMKRRWLLCLFSQVLRIFAFIYCIPQWADYKERQFCSISHFLTILVACYSIVWLHSNRSTSVHCISKCRTKRHFLHLSDSIYWQIVFFIDHWYKKRAN